MNYIKYSLGIIFSANFKFGKIISFPLTYFPDNCVITRTKTMYFPYKL